MQLQRIRHDLVTEQQQQRQEVFILLFLRTYHFLGASKPESLCPYPYGASVSTSVLPVNIQG